LLEIGVHSGGSLEMWKHYLGPKCQIYGIDREVACKVYEDERTKIFVGDQGDQAFWKRLKDEVPIVDIVVDDGGHHPEHQLLTLQEMLPHLSAGGIYICEDVHGVSNRFTAYVYGLVDQLNAFVQTAPGALDCQATRFQELVRSIHLYPYVIVIETVVRPNSRLVCERHGTEWQPF
jgi:cephalosporin hydroxylase